MTLPSSSAEWCGEVRSSSGAAGRAAAYDVACCSLAADMGRRLAAESKRYRLFREEEHWFGVPAGCQIARVWLKMCADRVLRRDSAHGDTYACVVTLEGDLPNLTTVRRDLLTDEVLSDRRIHPLVLVELASCDDEREDVLNAFVDRLSSPVLADYFLRRKISCHSPFAAFELHRHPEVLDELPPTELLWQLQSLPGDLSIMKALIRVARDEGRTYAAKWLGDCLPARADKEPKFVTTTWPRVAARARRAHRFVTPALKWFYASRRICRHGSVRPPEDDHFAKARMLAEAGMHREAYGHYLRSADRVLSYDACLGASECAAHVDELSAEADFFLLQAVVIDKDREPARERLFARERQLSETKGGIQ